MSKRFVGVLTALTVFAPAVPVFAKTAVSIENVTKNQLQTVDKVLVDVSDTISNVVDSIKMEEQKEEVSYVYYEQPEYTQVVYYEIPVVEEVAPVLESVQMMDDSYSIALSNYEKALEAYYAASQLVETTREEQVEVTEEVIDEEGNVSTVTKTEIQTFTETGPAGDVDAAQAALDAASEALEKAKPTQVTETVIDEDVTSEPILKAVAENQCGDDATWSLSDMGELTISGTGEMYNYTSTEHAPWYSEKLLVNSVVVESGITRIGNYAFDQCNKIRSVTLSDTVTSIGEYAFNNEGVYGGSRLKEIVIPDSVITIESHAFNYCNKLNTVVMGSGITTIGQYAFNFCDGLETVELGSGLNTIEKYAFNRCSNLTGITIPDSVTTIGDYAFNWCKGMTSVQYGTGLITIGTQAFYQCQSIESLVLPDSMRTIGEGAFMLCVNLNSIILNNGLQTIGDSVFRNCNALTTIEIPSTVTSIGTNALGSCASLMSINVDASNTRYTDVDGILYDKEITTLIQCPVGKTDVSIPNSVTKIGNSAFYQCSNLLAITFTENIQSLGSDAFYGCNGLSEVVLPDSVTTIGNSVFSMARNLTTVDLGASVVSIPTFAFLSCDKMTSITLPSTLTSIASNAFTSCTALTDVYYLGKQSEWEEKSLHTFPETVNMHYSSDYVKRSSHSLNLKGKIGVNFYLSFTDEILQDENAVVELTVDKKTSRFLIKDAPTDEYQGMIEHMFSIDVAPAQLSTPVTAKVLLSDGTNVYRETYSAQQYCYNKIANPSTSQKTLDMVKALLNYGSYVQLYFDYNTDNLANEGLSEDEKKVSDVTPEQLSNYAPVKTGSETGLLPTGTSIIADTTTSIRHFFMVEDGYDIEDYTFQVDGIAVEPIKSGNEYYIEIANIPAAELDKMYELKVGNYTVRYGALSYAYNKLSNPESSEKVKNMSSAMYKYNVAAKAYFAG